MTEQPASSSLGRNLDPSRGRYLAALHRVSGVVARVARTDRWDDPSPCPGWTSRHVLGHLVDGQRQVSALVVGQPPPTPAANPAVVAGADPSTIWEVARDEITATLAELTDDTRSARTVTTPMGQRDLPELLDTAIIELQVHAWDLAAAGSVEVDLDADDVRNTLGLLEGMGAALHHSGMYDAALPVAPEMSPDRRLLALTGRDPDWQVEE